MTHPCEGHVCDHCQICDEVGECCGSGGRANAVFLINAQAKRLSALQARTDEAAGHGGATRPTWADDLTWL